MSKELKNLANKNLSFPVPSGEFKIRRIITLEPGEEATLSAD